MKPNVVYSEINKGRVHSTCYSAVILFIFIYITQHNLITFQIKVDFICWYICSLCYKNTN